MAHASAFVPGHLTGFFQICDGPEDLLRKGSRGSGFSITRGIFTTAHVEDAVKRSVSIIINGEVTRAAVVSENVVSRMLSKYGKPCKIVVTHETAIPIGAGFGASGAGALGLALALNEAMGLGLSRIEASRVAHIAEIECKTGLGTVLAGLNGGFGVIIKPGGPGIGEAIKFRHDADLSAAILHFGPISTKEALSDPELRSRVNELGGKFVDELRTDQSADLFMRLSRRFAEHVGLITPRIRAILEKADQAGFLCTMAMFGETVFSLVKGEEAEEIADLMRAAAPGHKVLVDTIDDQGARLVQPRESKGLAP